MSTVTNAILAYSIMEDDLDEFKKLDEVNKFFKHKGFVHIDTPELPVGWYGGTKMMETNIALGAFNYLEEQEFIEYLRSIKWEEPENVQLMLQRQEDEKFEFVINGIIPNSETSSDKRSK